MKQVSLLLVCVFTHAITHAQVKIGLTPGTSHPAAILELEAGNRGLLLPRLSQAEMLGVATDGLSRGLLIYNTDSDRLYLFDGGNWRPMQYGGVNSHWLLTGNSGSNAGNHFVGTTDSVDLVFRTNNLRRFTVKANGYAGLGTADPISALDIVNNGAGDGFDDINIRSFNNTGGPALLLARARGTGNSPVNLQTNDFLGILNFAGRVNGNTTGLSSIIANYTGDGTTVLSTMSFRTSGAQGMLLNDKGWLTIGNSTVSAQATADIQGSVRFRVAVPTNTSVYTVTSTDLMVYVSLGIGPSAIALPSTPDFDGHFIIIKNSGAASVSLSTGSGALICTGTACSTLGAGKVIGLVGKAFGNTTDWIQVF